MCQSLNDLEKSVWRCLSFLIDAQFSPIVEENAPHFFCGFVFNVALDGIALNALWLRA